MSGRSRKFLLSPARSPATTMAKTEDGRTSRDSLKSFSRGWPLQNRRLPTLFDSQDTLAISLQSHNNSNSKMDLSLNIISSTMDNRSLRGGSGGGGGGSSGGGISNGNNNGGEGESLPFYVPIIGGVLAFVFGICFCWRIRKKRQDQALFEETVNKAKDAVMQTSRATLSYERKLPHSGEYSTEYLDRGKKMTGTITLTFTDNQTDGYSLNGHGSDVDGTTNVEDGFASYNGEAWWKEKNVSGDVGMQVLSTGKFDFEAHTFEGEWQSSTNLNGAYTSFSATNPPPSTSTVVPSSPPEQDAVDIALDSDYSYAPSVSGKPSKY